IYSIIFYMPRATAKAIRSVLNKKSRTNTIIEKVEYYVESQIRKNIPNINVFNLNGESSEVASIFDINLLKRELDKDSKGEFKKIYFIGLRFNLNFSNRLGFYLNNQEIYEESGTIYGDSKILKNRIKRGFISIKSDECVELEFFNTDKYRSADYDIGSDLEDLDYQHDTLSFELDAEIDRITLNSKGDERLIFSLNPIYDSTAKVDSQNRDTQSLKVGEDRAYKIYMESFFIPRGNGLKRVHLLLVDIDGKRVLAGGEYHKGLEMCSIIASITVDLGRDTIDIFNRSDSELSFTNFDNLFWKLDDSRGDMEGIYTNVLLDEIPDKYKVDSSQLDVKEVIAPDKSFKFNTKEVEFNDTNLSIDSEGVTLRYYSLEIAKFRDEFKLNRMAYKMSKYGTLIDCSVERPKGRYFKWGGKEYKSHQDILGRVISSKPVYIKAVGELLMVESRLNSQYYIVRLLYRDREIILGDGDEQVTIPDIGVDELTIDIVSRGYLDRPLVQFSVKVD
ncbi:MAG: hypothetical protein GXO06_01175, partial [Epsilonproteobacteria bacterium]|nr:hypothetical protein [Campylobacterota bacterium]